MAKLDIEMVRKLAKLCRIRCSEDEEKKLLSDLQQILNYVDQLSEINTEQVAPCNHVLEGMVNVSREDKVENVMPRELFLANVPDKIGGMVRVPPVQKSSS